MKSVGLITPGEGCEPGEMPACHGRTSGPEVTR